MWTIIFMATVVLERGALVTVHVGKAVAGAAPRMYTAILEMGLQHVVCYFSFNTVVHACMDKIDICDTMDTVKMSIKCGKGQLCY